MEVLQPPYGGEVEETQPPLLRSSMIGGATAQLRAPGMKATRFPLLATRAPTGWTTQPRSTDTGFLRDKLSLL